MPNKLVVHAAAKSHPNVTGSRKANLALAPSYAV